MSTSSSGAGFQIEALEDRTLLSGSGPRAHVAVKPVLPSAPQVLNATSATSSSITLSWLEDDTTGTAIGYKISRWDGRKWKSIGTVRGVSTQQFTDKKLKVATYYAYSVRAFNSRGQSEAVFNYGLPTAAGSPFGLHVSAAWDTALTLSWKVNPAQVTSQDVLQKRPDGSLTFLGSVSATTTSYTVSNLLPGASYDFEVYGVGFGGSGDHPALLAHAHSNAPMPATPTSLTSPHVTANSIQLAWKDAAKDQTGYELQQSTGADWTTIAELQPNVFGYTATGLTQETDYSYRLFSVENGVRSTAPVQLGPIHTAAANSVPYPTDISVTTGPTYAEISLTDNATNEQAIKIEVSTDNNHWTTYNSFSGSPATGPRLYVVSGLTPSTMYYFRVTAVNGDASSLYSLVTASTSALVDRYSTTYLLANGLTLKQTGTSTTPVPTGDGGSQWKETQGFTRYNLDGTVDTTYGNNGMVTVWAGTVGYSNHSPFFNPGHFLSNVNVSPDGALVAISETTLNSYGGPYPQFASTISINAEGTRISTAGYVPTGGQNISLLAESDFRFFWTPQGKLIEFEPPTSNHGWYVVGLNADLTVDKTFSAGNIELPGLREAGPDGILELADGVFAVTYGKYATLFNSKLAIQPAGFNAPTNASFVSYGNQNSLQFNADSSNETGYVLRVVHYADASVTDIPISLTVGSGTFVLNNFTNSTIGPYDSLELFAVNGSLRTAGAVVSRGV